MLSHVKAKVISLCMIVKNEQEHLPRCLASVKPIVDEIVLVDTGSWDQTKAIALQFGARVFDFVWTGNFSDARNFSLSLATGKWILILDADEVISSRDYHALRSLAQGHENVAYNLITRNYVNNPNAIGWIANDGSYLSEEAGTGYVRGDKVRMFPNDARIRFDYPVHERVEPSLSKYGFQILPADVIVHHYGFLKEQCSVQKSEQYLEMLKSFVDADAEITMSMLYHAASEAMQLGKFEEALTYWKKLLLADYNFPKIFYYIGNTYLHLGKYREAREALKKSLEREPDSHDTIVLYAQSELCAGDIEQAIKSLKSLLARDPSYPLALFPLAIAYILKGSRDEGMRYIRKLREMNYGCALYFTEFSKMLIAAGRITFAVALLEASVESNNINNETWPLLNACYTQLQPPE